MNDNLLMIALDFYLGNMNHIIGQARSHSRHQVHKYLLNHKRIKVAPEDYFVEILEDNLPNRFMKL